MKVSDKCYSEASASAPALPSPVAAAIPVGMAVQTEHSKFLSTFSSLLRTSLLFPLKFRQLFLERHTAKASPCLIRGNRLERKLCCCPS